MPRIFTAKCFKCGNSLSFPEGNVGRGQMCPFCNADIRVCLNCKYYNVQCYNECEEPTGDRVVDKQRSNFCEMFVFVGGQQYSAPVEKENVYRQLEDLFKK